MNVKEILIHRIRDFDSIFRSRKKLNLLCYVLLRQIIKLLGVDERKIIRLIRENQINLYNYTFLTRAKTLDFLFFSKFYEPETTRYILKKRGRVFIDIGAHLGRYSILASKNFEKIYAIEPHPLNYKMLRKNLQHNNVKNVYAINIALSSKNTYVYLSDLDVNTGAVKVSDKGRIKVRAFKLDYLIEEMLYIDIMQIDLIKIDAEGHEFEILEGALNLLKKGNPILIIESENPRKLEDILSNFGFKRIYTLDFYNHVFYKSKIDC